MASIRKEIHTSASPEQVWEALRDVGSLLTRLVSGFVVDTRVEPGERIVTFGNGIVIREPIIDVNDKMRRVAWSANGGQLRHYNASAQVFVNANKQTTIEWIAELFPNEAAARSVSRWKKAWPSRRQRLTASRGIRARHDQFTFLLLAAATQGISCTGDLLPQHHGRVKPA